MKEKLCLIYNTAPSYRKSIFIKIDESYDCDWYFSNKDNGVKQMNKQLLRNVFIYKMLNFSNKLVIKLGLIRLLFLEKYNTFFILAESRCITDWAFIWVASHFFKRKKVYIWSHGWYGKESKFEASIKKWMFSHVSGTFVYGNYAKQLMIKNGIDGNKLFVIHNSLDYDEQLVLRTNIETSDLLIKHFNNDNPILIMIGRIDRRKCMDMLLEAAYILKQRGENYNIVMIGDGEDRPRLEKLAKDKNLEKNIWFYGKCFDERANAELLFNADLCVVPGHLGLTAIHSMMFGCPVITHNNFAYQAPEFEAIKEQETGDFFQEGNPNDLANKISNWFLNHQSDREKVRGMCYHEIDSQWNPEYQIELIKSTIK